MTSARARGLRFAVVCMLASSLPARVLAADPLLESLPAAAEPFPAHLGGELLVFDLRRLELLRSDPDGGRVRRIRVDMGDAESKGLNAASASASGAGAAIAAGGLAASAGGGMVAPAAGLGLAAGGLIALPALGILQAVKVAKRHGRPVRNYVQVQPLAAVAPSGREMLLCFDVGPTVFGSQMKLIQLGGPDGRKTTLIQRFPFGGVAPDISPDGKTVLFVAAPTKKAGSEIYRLSLEKWKSSLKRLTTDGGGKTFPRWSPDGEWIAFQGMAASGDDAAVQIFVMPAAGGDPRAVTRDPAGAVTPSWSPDGERIAYASLDDGSIHSVLPDGSDDVALTAAGNSRLHPQFSPDGLHVMFLESTHDAIELDNDPATEQRKLKTRLGKDFRLQLLRLSDGKEWPVPLAHGDGAGAEVIEKTNLFWFQWLRTSPS